MFNIATLEHVAEMEYKTHEFHINTLYMELNMLNLSTPKTKQFNFQYLLVETVHTIRHATNLYNELQTAHPYKYHNRIAHYILSPTADSLGLIQTHPTETFLPNVASLPLRQNPTTPCSLTASNHTDSISRPRELHPQTRRCQHHSSDLLCSANDSTFLPA